MIQVARNHNCLTYKNDAYNVNHIRENDYNCDLHILVCPIDQNIYSETNGQEQGSSSTILDKSANSSFKSFSKTILVPVDRNVLIENLNYFKGMFREGSNWIEGIDRDGASAEKKQKFDPDAKIIKIHMPKPELFIKYLESVYTKCLNITKDNCIDFHYIADYLQDEEMLTKICDFISKNLSYSNVVDILLANTDKFKNAIGQFFAKNKLKDADFVEFTNRIARLSVEKFVIMLKMLKDNNCVDPQTYVKIIKIWISSAKDPATALTEVIFDTDTSKLSFEERYEFFNHCIKIEKVNKFESKTFLDMYNHILGVKGDVYPKVEIDTMVPRFCSTMNYDKSDYEADVSIVCEDAREQHLDETILKMYEDIMKMAILDESVDVYINRTYISNKLGLRFIKRYSTNKPACVRLPGMGIQGCRIADLI